ncbi:radical SAM protein [Chromobacterium paludis]|uniref:Radical SAM protein n=1 Tax=Chromobacterium paludis TaxID=2605945 RepID=A0A5C1DJ92_9NEIS|nr:radical SAM protein [Chromobacterium paludis]QEL56623.1 radical SAM protein [Chromobacterium paludis]
MGQISRPLSLVEKLKQESVQDFINKFLWNKSNKAPLVVELDPTTACNLACHDCISANLLNQGGIDNERLLRLAQEFAEHGVRAVVLIGGGEPMAHPKFSALVDALYDSGIKVGVTTNGTLIQRSFEQCVDKTSWLRVSVDAGSEEVFAEFRPHASGKSQFNLVIDNMRKMAKSKKGLLGYSFLLLSKFADDGRLLSTNAVDIEKAALLAKDIGCDYFELKPAFDMMHFLQQQDLSVVEMVNASLKRIHELADESFKIIAPFTLEEALNGIGTQIKPYNRCLTAELRTVITPSGAYVCPYHRGNLNMRIGDIAKVSLEELWKGDRRAKVMDRVDPAKHCTFHCIRHESNLLLERMAAGEVVDAVPDFDLFI